LWSRGSLATNGDRALHRRPGNEEGAETSANDDTVRRGYEAFGKVSRLDEEHPDLARFEDFFS
jgi:hypothetical protein